MSRVVARILAWLPAPVVRRAADWQLRHVALARLGRIARRAGAGDLVIDEGDAAGLRFNSFGTGSGLASGRKERDVQRELASLITPGCVVYDVGAAVGFYTLLAARCAGSAGRVVAFDPLPENVTAIEYNVALNQLDHVEVRQTALAERAGTAWLRLGRERTQGRLDSLAGNPASLGAGRIQVEMTTIDTLVASGSLPAPDVIKLDVEGAEVEVLRGARKTLREKRPAIVAEMHGRAREVAEVLEQAGYAASVIGDTTPVASARWSSHVVATPGGR